MSEKMVHPCHYYHNLLLTLVVVQFKTPLFLRQGHSEFLKHAWVIHMHPELCVMSVNPRLICKYDWFLMPRFAVP
jgi:hypothetical protein